jgi:protein TonB
LAHTSPAAHQMGGLGFHLIPSGSVCPEVTADHKSNPRDQESRLIPLGSVCPAPGEGHQTSADRAFRVAATLVPPGSKCSDVPGLTGKDGVQSVEMLARLGSRLVPAGSTCRVSAEAVIHERLDEPTFASAFLVDNRIPGTSRSAAMICSIAFQALLLTVLLVVPILFTASPDLRHYAVTMLSPPLPPPALPAPVPTVHRLAATQPEPPKTFVRQGKLSLPMSFPKHAAVIKEAPPAPEVSPSAFAGGVYGGLPVDLTGLTSGGLAEAPPPPPAPVASAPVISEPKKPLRVGGVVLAPRLIHLVEPDYPMQARQARIEGDVVISATIDEQGNVVKMQPISGPSMLYAAAMDALQEWKFEPTRLNGELWPIQWEVTLHFQLGRRAPARRK